MNDRVRKLSLNAKIVIQVGIILLKDAFIVK